MFGGYPKSLLGLALTGPWGQMRSRVVPDGSRELFDTNGPEITAQLEEAGLRDAQISLVVPLSVRGRHLGALILDRASSDGIAPAAQEAVTKWAAAVAPILSILEGREEWKQAARQLTGALVEAVESQDFDSLGHAQAVTDVSLKLGRAVGLTDRELEELWFASMLHDIGNQIHRVGHEAHGVALALPILDRIMTPLYPDPFKRVKVRSFILGAINCHDLNPAPLTMEGGIVAVADGTDITKGRGRVDIHSISALAVDQVVIERGRDKPVLISVTMNNSGGIFQVEEILAPKVIRTPMRRFVDLRATTRPEGEEQILSRVRLDGDHFVMDLESGAQVEVEVMDTQKQVQQAVANNLGISSETR